ncbi:unnamed protein product [Aphanomyces euteiches]
MNKSVAEGITTTEMNDAERDREESLLDTEEDYGTSQGEIVLPPKCLEHSGFLGFFSFASQLGRQLTQDAMELSTTAVETAKYLAVESTKVVEKASLLAQESLADAFETATNEPQIDLIVDLPWIDSAGEAIEKVKDEIFAISGKKANFKQLSLDFLSPIFDIDRFVQVAPELLALDAQLRQRHFELSYKLPEDVFWGNYFFQCHVVRVQNGLAPYFDCKDSPEVPGEPTTNQTEEEEKDEAEDAYVYDDVPETEGTEEVPSENQTDEPKKASTFSAMKSNLMHRSTQAKQKMQDIKRKIHFPSPDKIKELQSSLMRRKSSVSDSFERLSVSSLSFAGLKRSPSLRMRSKSGASNVSESDELETLRLSELGTPPSATANRSHTFDE